MNGDGTKVVRKKVVVNKDEKKIINSIKKVKTPEEMANF